MRHRISDTLKQTVLSPLRPIFRSFTLSRIQNSLQRKDLADWPLPQLKDKKGLEKYEYSLFSQNGEDGILRYLFSQTGFHSRQFLEFGFGVSENNSLRLILKENFGGVFIDGSQTTVRYFNDLSQRCGLTNVKAIQKFLDLENLQPTILQSGLPKEIDLLSIDVDGNDYWFWKEINCISPRVVIVEYNASLGPELSLCVPYDPLFDRHQKHPSGFYCSASITALERLGKQKGYALAGCDSNGVNAFFVRQDCVTKNMEILSPQDAYRPHKDRLERGFSVEEQFRIIKEMPYITIE